MTVHTTMLRRVSTGLAAATLALSLSACGGNDNVASAADDTGSDAVATVAADTPEETLRRWAELYIDGDLEGACKLSTVSEDPVASYPDLMDECLSELSEEEDINKEVLLLMAKTPDERIEQATNGVGDPQLRYKDESAEQFGVAEFDEVDGFFYLATVTACC